VAGVGPAEAGALRLYSLYTLTSVTIHGLTGNSNIDALPAYNAGMNIEVARAATGLSQFARLASNENPHGCSPAVLAVLASDAFEPWRYNDPACVELRAKLGQHLDLPPDRIVVGNGSEELIAAATRAFVMPGDTFVTVLPSFGRHEIEALAVGARLVKLEMSADLDFPLDALEAALAQDPAVLMLSSPWNPVGAALDAAGLQRLIDATQQGTLFVLDEAYIEFADAGSPDGVEMLRASGVAHVVLRTFSKAYGLAGLRVGYGACSHPDIARMLTGAKTPFDVNSAAQLAAVAALGDGEWMRATTALIVAERQRVAEALAALRLRTSASQANFVFFDCGTDSGEFSTALLHRGVIVKDWREPGYTNYIRASIGSPADNDLLIAAVTEVIGEWS
jgi:histidinol-phosphate aminotransferase